MITVIIKLFVIKLINDTMLKYKIITEAFSRLVSIVVSYKFNNQELKLQLKLELLHPSLVKLL